MTTPAPVITLPFPLNTTWSSALSAPDGDTSGPCPGADNQTFHSSSYSLSGTELLRNYDGTESVVGRNITSIGFTQDARVVNVVITATGPGIQQRSETLEFSTCIRAEEVE